MRYALPIGWAIACLLFLAAAIVAVLDGDVLMAVLGTAGAVVAMIFCQVTFEKSTREGADR